MSLRTKYVLWYVASLVAPFIIFIAGAILIYSSHVADNSMSVTALYLICFLIFLAGGFWANFWYSKTLGLHMIWRVLAAIFSTIGFFYLLGYDKNLIPSMQIVSDSVEFCAANWKILIKYSLLFLIPTTILALVGSASFVMSYYAHASAILNGLVILLIVALSLVVTLWLSISLAQIIKNLLNKQPLPPTKQILLANSHLLWPVIYTSAISALIILGGSILFLVPGIIFSMWYAFIFYAVVFEKQGGLSALRYSKSMVVERWFAILWRITVPAVVFGLAAYSITYIVEFPLFFFPTNTTTGLIGIVINNLVSILLMPLTTTASVILYLNAKKSKPTTSGRSDTPVIM